MNSDTRKILDLENRIDKLEKAVFSEPHNLDSINTLETVLIKNIDSISVPRLIIISLHIHHKQTVKEIQGTLKEWGKNFRTWFKGGNFNNRLLSANIVKESENQDNKKLYELTKKGKIDAGQLIKEITHNSSNQ